MQLDLHGLTVHLAWKETVNFITESYFLGHKSVIIICGHGLIKNEIEKWFLLHPKVASYQLLKNGGSYKLKLVKRPVKSY